MPKIPKIPKRLRYPVTLTPRQFVVRFGETLPDDLIAWGEQNDFLRPDPITHEFWVDRIICGSGNGFYHLYGRHRSDNTPHYQMGWVEDQWPLITVDIKPVEKKKDRKTK